MTENYTLKNGKDIYLNEDQICTASKEIDSDGNPTEYTIFVMSNGNIVTAKEKSQSTK